MMTRDGAIAYGKMIGVKYHLVSTNGGLFGGYTTLEAAKAAKREWELDDKKNPWTKGTTKFEIKKV